MKKLNLNNAQFIKSALKAVDYPHHTLPEIAIVGRSNVGKSSLINYLFNRKSLAKVSATPGKTTLINFFNIDDAFMLVDLPGYGFAKRSKTEQENWAKAIDTYLTQRKQLKAILFLLDLRRSPSEDDHEFFNWASYSEMELIFVLTKADKIPKTKRLGQAKKILQAFNNQKGYHIITSSSSGIGRDELNATLLKVLSDQK